jgi:hypothetical protein
MTEDDPEILKEAITNYHETKARIKKDISELNSELKSAHDHVEEVLSARKSSILINQTREDPLMDWAIVNFGLDYQKLQEGAVALDTYLRDNNGDIVLYEEVWRQRDRVVSAPGYDERTSLSVYFYKMWLGTLNEEGLVPSRKDETLDLIIGLDKSEEFYLFEKAWNGKETIKRSELPLIINSKLFYDLKKEKDFCWKSKLNCNDKRQWVHDSKDSWVRNVDDYDRLVEAKIITGLESVSRELAHHTLRHKIEQTDSFEEMVSVLGMDIYEYSKLSESAKNIN